MRRPTRQKSKLGAIIEEKEQIFHLFQNSLDLGEEATLSTLKEKKHLKIA